MVLWRPRGPKGVDAAGGDENRNEFGWRFKTHFGLDWRGHGNGWEVRATGSLRQGFCLQLTHGMVKKYGNTGRGGSGDGDSD